MFLFKKHLTIIFMLLFSGFIYSQENKTNQLPAIAVLDFEPRGNVTTDISDFVSDRVRIELFKTGKFRIVERRDMQKILEEQKMELSGLTGSEYAVKVGKLLSAQKILLGTVNRMGESYFINGRIIDVETAVMESGDTAEAASTSVLSDSSRKLVAGIVNPASAQSPSSAGASSSSGSGKISPVSPIMPNFTSLNGDDLTSFINSTIDYFKSKVDTAISESKIYEPVSTSSSSSASSEPASNTSSSVSGEKPKEAGIETQPNKSRISPARLIVGESLGFCIPGLGLAHYVVGDWKSGLGIMANSMVAAGLFLGNEYAYQTKVYDNLRVYRGIQIGCVVMYGIGWLTDIIGAPIYYFDQNSQVALGLTIQKPVFALQGDSIQADFLTYKMSF